MFRIRPIFSGRLPWAGALFLAFILLDATLLAKFTFGTDCALLWVAGHLGRSDPAKIYDFTLITRLQAPLVGDPGLRPFIYPPTSLIALVPLSLLPFYAAFGCVALGGWTALSKAAPVGNRERVLLMISPPVVLAAMSGQPTLIVAALITAALVRLESNEIAAGILLGCAAVIKPTLLIMAPFGLAGGRHWRAFASAAATACALLLVSLLLFGSALWRDWFEAIARFRVLFDFAEPLYRNAITPYAFALRFGIVARWIPWLLFPFAAVATAAVFARDGNWRARLAVAVGGSLLVSPYALNYELAALAPAALSLRREKLSDFLTPALWAVSLFFNASLLGLTLVYGRSFVSGFRRSGGHDEGMEGGIDIPAGQDDDRPLLHSGLTA